MRDDAAFHAGQAPDIEIIKLGPNDARRMDKPPFYEVDSTRSRPSWSMSSSCATTVPQD